MRPGLHTPGDTAAAGLPTPPAKVAATAWRLQFADHWQAHEAGGRAGDELRLAVAHLRTMLADEDEIRWRRRGVQGLVSLMGLWGRHGCHWHWLHSMPMR